MSGRIYFISFVLIFITGSIFSGCSVAPGRSSMALIYENNQIIKDYEKEKKQLSNPQIDKDEGYCPLCEL